MQHYIGLDPGVSGGIAAVVASADEFFYRAWKMPATDRDICDLLRSLVPVQGTAFAVIEKVNPGVFSRPGAKMGVVSAFTFGGGYRALKMALTCVEIPYDEVLPVKWQTAMGCRSKGNKNITKARAQALFPEITITHAIADALLIAEFCRRLHSGEARPARPAQQELEYGKEDDEAITVKEVSEVIEAIEAGARAAHSTAVCAAGNGRPRHRGHRKGGA